MFVYLPKDIYFGCLQKTCMNVHFIQEYFTVNLLFITEIHMKKKSQVIEVLIAFLVMDRNKIKPRQLQKITNNYGTVTE